MKKLLFVTIIMLSAFAVGCKDKPNDGASRHADTETSAISTEVENGFADDSVTQDPFAFELPIIPLD